jgi:hypothetical protein
MEGKPYAVVSGIVFALVALAHLIRAIQGWPVLIGDWQLAVWVSWLAVLIAGGLAVWAFSIARK